jgi:hypothetical protein
VSDLLTELRAHLVGEDIVRVPRTPGPRPPLFLEPRRGVPAPGEGKDPERGVDAVIGAWISGGIPPRPYESWQRRQIVDLRLRTAEGGRAHELDAAIRAVLIDRRAWTMGTLRVLESQLWRELQPLGAGEQGFEHVVAYVFQLYDQP